VPSAATQRTRQLGPGDKLGKYEVIRQIAIGGMAELYLARTSGIEGFEKLVVIKRILPQYVASSSFVNMFLNEARIAATLHHPNVAQVYDIGLEDGDYFFAMEYVHGEDLDHISIASEEQGVPISMDASLTLVAGLCAGLHYAHEKVNAEGKPLGIVHRDVSPSNVLVSYDGAVKLVDFGIARASSRPGTTQGGLKGKIAFMSPEQCKAKATLDRRSDIYSIGTLLYELTTGRLPFTGETEYQILNQIVNEDAPAPSTLVPDYPPALEKIVLKALAREPEQRFSTALEMQGAIEDFAHDTRLRISPLVLGRLMGTLFPSRLEDWDHAKTQGAFFVEQHVVRTLIESGKTPDPNDAEQRAVLVAMEAQRVAAAERAAAADEDETTHVNQAPLTDLGGDTSVGAPPISTFVSEQTTVDSAPMLPPPPQVSVGAADPRPEPAYPVMSVAQAGKLYSSSQALPAALAAAVEENAPTTIGQSIDVTAQVRVPQRRLSSPTTFVRTASNRKPMLLIGGCALVGAAIALVIVMKDGSKDVAPAAAPTDKQPEAEVIMNPDPAPAPVVETPTPPVPDEPTVATKVEAPKPTPKVEKPKSVAKVEKPVVEKKPVAVVAKPKPKPKTETTKQEPKKWNTDSVFLPVRTDK
jgi:serine/threonine protein kinase